MASRAELIMAQVRGGLAQEYREKGPTKGQGIIQDLTGAALGYSTASEAIYAVEGGIQKIKDRRYKNGKMNPMNNKSYVSSLQTPDTEDVLSSTDDDQLDENGDFVDTEIEDSITHQNKRFKFDALENNPYEIYGDEAGDGIYQQKGRPGTRPDTAITYGPEQGVDTTKPAILPSEKLVSNSLKNNMLQGTLNFYQGVNGPMTESFSESTGFKYGDNTGENLSGINSQSGPPNVNYEAAGITAWNTGRNMSDVNTLRGINNMDYLMNVDNKK